MTGERISVISNVKAKAKLRESYAQLNTALNAAIERRTGETPLDRRRYFGRRGKHGKPA